MSLDRHDRRTLFEIAIVVAAVAGVIAAALLIATPLSVGAILVTTATLFLVGFVVLVVFFS